MIDHSDDDSDDDSHRSLFPSITTAHRRVVV